MSDDKQGTLFDLDAYRGAKFIQQVDEADGGEGAEQIPTQPKADDRPGVTVMLEDVNPFNGDVLYSCVDFEGAGVHSSGALLCSNGDNVDAIIAPGRWITVKAFERRADARQHAEMMSAYFAGSAVGWVRDDEDGDK